VVDIMNIFENLEIQINNLRDITRDIDENRNIPNLANSLLFESFYPKRIQVISEILMNIKSSIDITYKIEIPNEILQVRQLVIDLAIATKDLHTNIMNADDNLVRKYNYEIIGILDRAK